MRVEYSAILEGTITLLENAINKSDGTVESMLKEFDIRLFKRLSQLDFSQKNKKYETMLNWLSFPLNRRHDLHEEVLSLLPDSLNKGFIYITHDKSPSVWNTEEHTSLLVTKPHMSYCFLDVSFCSKNLCLKRVYAYKIDKIRDGKFNIVSVEGNLMDILEMLHEFV